ALPIFFGASAAFTSAGFSVGAGVASASGSGSGAPATSGAVWVARTCLASGGLTWGMLPALDSNSASRSSRADVDMMTPMWEENWWRDPSGGLASIIPHVSCGDVRCQIPMAGLTGPTASGDLQDVRAADLVQLALRLDQTLLDRGLDEAVAVTRLLRDGFASGALAASGVPRYEGHDGLDLRGGQNRFGGRGHAGLRGLGPAAPAALWFDISRPASGGQDGQRQGFPGHGARLKAAHPESAAETARVAARLGRMRHQQCGI